MNVAASTMQAKAKIIRESLELVPWHPEWCLSSLIDENPLVWMCMVDGIVVDMRTAPRELQVVAYQDGAIPYIPADRLQRNSSLRSE